MRYFCFLSPIQIFSKENLAVLIFVERLLVSSRVLKYELLCGEIHFFFLSDSERDHSLHEDDFFWDGSDQELENPSDLDRDWQRRREQFHTVIWQSNVDFLVHLL